MYNCCRSTAARTLVWADPSLRHTRLLLGRWATSQPTNRAWLRWGGNWNVSFYNVCPQFCVCGSLVSGCCSATCQLQLLLCDKIALTTSLVVIFVCLFVCLDNFHGFGEWTESGSHIKTYPREHRSSPCKQKQTINKKEGKVKTEKDIWITTNWWISQTELVQYNKSIGK